jgi:diacylglycerol kinase (ATP)
MADPHPPPARGRGFRLRGFADAWHGIKLVVLTQPNARVHLASTVVVIAAGAWLGVETRDWALLTLAITGVWVSEALNTAIEFAVDLVTQEHQRLAGWAKDVAAGAVLLASLGAVAVGVFVFGPKLLALWQAKAS